ncbi:MAG: hypothetical protein QXK08_02905 [Candidatus Woesearchaeota archaeon]
MNKIKEGLVALAIGYFAGCAGEQPQPVEAPQPPAQAEAAPVRVPKKVDMTHDYLANAEVERMNLRKDDMYTPAELSDVIFQYQTLKMSEPGDKADAKLKQRYNDAVAECEKTINDAFDNAEIYAYVGLVSDKASGNRRANLGGDKKLYVGKGKDVAKELSMAQKIELLRKARPEWAPYASKGRVLDSKVVYATSMGVDMALFDGVLVSRNEFGVKDDEESHYLDGPRWLRLNNHSTDYDPEVRDDHLRLMAVYNGHALPEPAKAEPPKPPKSDGFHR